jgi:YidC/Oxa1 family membrane protein insertase
MRLVTLLLVLTANVSAFVPAALRGVTQSKIIIRPSALSFGIDPSHFVDTIQQFASSSMLLSDAAAVDVVSNAVDVVTNSAAAVVDTAATATTVAPTDYGWFGFLTIPIEGVLQIIHNVIASTGSGNSWGVSIIVLTLLIKALTFPLTKTQLESTNKMQAMQPAIKEIQLKYQSNPEVMNQKIAEFYQVNEINPLAGCLPSLVQIPVFIGLYRAVLELAQQNKLNEGFLFLPSLEGPTYGADPSSASDWILKGW